jgi:hypothetical protein
MRSNKRVESDSLRRRSRATLAYTELTEEIIW